MVAACDLEPRNPCLAHRESPANYVMHLVGTRVVWADSPHPSRGIWSVTSAFGGSRFVQRRSILLRNPLVVEGMKSDTTPGNTSKPPGSEPIRGYLSLFTVICCKGMALGLLTDQKTPLGNVSKPNL